MITQLWTSYARDGIQLNDNANKMLRRIHDIGGTLVSVRQEVVVRHRVTLFVVFIQYQVPADVEYVLEMVGDSEPAGGVT